MDGRTYRVVGLISALALGCSSQPGSPDSGGSSHPTSCVTRDQVLNVAPGTASGTVYSGNYSLVSGYLDDCYACEDNQNERYCDDFYPIAQEGTLLTVTQADGLATLEGSGDTVELSIDSDGSFSGGAIVPVYETMGRDDLIIDDGAVIGTAYFLIEGSFSGEYMFWETRMHSLANPPEGFTDIEMHGSATFVRVGG